jgi:hypothetical protein
LTTDSGTKHEQTVHVLYVFRNTKFSVKNPITEAE